MNIKVCMIYKAVLEKRLARKRKQLDEIEALMKDAEAVQTGQDKRKYVELKAVVTELENCLDMAETMFNFQQTEEPEEKG